MRWETVPALTKLKLEAILTLVQIKDKTKEQHRDLIELWAWERESSITRKNIPQDIINEIMEIETIEHEDGRCYCLNCKGEK